MNLRGLAEAVDAYALSGLEGIRQSDVGLFEIAAKRCGVTLADGGWSVTTWLPTIGGEGAAVASVLRAGAS
jgi:putative hydrolase of the HAD superfamily